MRASPRRPPRAPCPPRRGSFRAQSDRIARRVPPFRRGGDGGREGPGPPLAGARPARPSWPRLPPSPMFADLPVRATYLYANLPSYRSGSRMSLGVQGRISGAGDERGESPTPGGHAKGILRRPPGPIACALMVAGKDLRIELRTREIVTTAGFFAALVAIMASVAFYSGTVTTTRVAPGAIWLAVAFASVLALGRTWQREREDSAL